MSALENKFFRNKVFSNNYTENEINSMLVSYKKENNTARVEILNEYLLSLKPVNVSEQEEDFEEYVARKYLMTKENAKIRGIKFTLKLSDIRNLLSTKTCFYTGLPFSKDIPDNNLTFDRKDPTKGYEKSNVVVCTWFANQFKNQFIEQTGAVLKDNTKVLLKLATKLHNVYPKPKRKVRVKTLVNKVNE